MARARTPRPEQLSDREYQIIRMLAEASKLPPDATGRVWRGRSPRWTLGEMIVGLTAWALAAAGLWSLVA